MRLWEFSRLKLRWNRQELTLAAQNLCATRERTATMSKWPLALRCRPLEIPDRDSYGFGSDSDCKYGRLKGPGRPTLTLLRWLSRSTMQSRFSPSRQVSDYRKIRRKPGRDPSHSRSQHKGDWHKGSSPKCMTLCHNKLLGSLVTRRSNEDLKLANTQALKNQHAVKLCPDTGSSSFGCSRLPNCAASQSFRLYNTLVGGGLSAKPVTKYRSGESTSYLPLKAYLTRNSRPALTDHPCNSSHQRTFETLPSEASQVPGTS